MLLHWWRNGEDLLLAESAGSRTRQGIVLLIHGNSMSGAIFARQYTGGLARRFRLTAPDLCGHGRSPRSENPGADYTPGGHARAICAQLARCNREEPVVLVGHSYGGHIALEVAARWPGTKGVVLVGMAPVRPDPGCLAATYHTLPGLELIGKECFSDDDVDAWTRICMHGTSGPVPDFVRDDIRACDGRHRTALMSAIRAGDLMDEEEFLRTTPLPIRFIMGEGERLVNRERLSALLSDCGREPAVAIPAAGHTAFWDNPDAFDRAVVAFVERIG